MSDHAELMHMLRSQVLCRDQRTGDRANQNAGLSLPRR